MRPRVVVAAALLAPLALAACQPGGGLALPLPPDTAEPGLDAKPLPAPAVESLSTICPTPDQAMVQSMLDAINAERTRLGRTPVTLNARLTTAAQAHACDMVQMGRLTVVGSNGNSVLDRARAVGYSACSSASTIGRGDPVSLVGRWATDPATRDGIVDQKFDHVGIGVQPGPGGLWWAVSSGDAC